jgi:predicted HAD superfamily Cof-like phosphohydrolase
MAREQKVKVRIEAKDDASREVKKTQTAFQRLGSSIKANALKITAALGTVAVAFAQMKKSSNFEQQRNALKIQLEASGRDFDAFLAKLTAVSRGTISQADLIASSTKAILLGIPVEKIADLLEVARASAIAMGISTRQAFEDIATGIGRASPLILDNLGLVIKLGDVYSKAAAAAGTTTENLTAQQRSMALLNGVLDTGRQRIAQFGEAQSRAAEATAQAEASIENLSNTLGAGLNKALVFAVGSFKGFGIAILQLYDVMGKANIRLLELVKGFGFFEEAIDRRIDKIRTMIREDEEWIEATEKEIRLLRDYVKGVEDAEKKTGGLTQAQRDNRTALEKLAGPLDTVTTAIEQETAATEQLIVVQKQLQTTYAETATAATRAASSFGRGSSPLFPGLSGTIYHYEGGRFVGKTQPRTVVTPDGRIIFQ